MVYLGWRGGGGGDRMPLLYVKDKDSHAPPNPLSGPPQIYSFCADQKYMNQSQPVALN